MGFKKVTVADFNLKSDSLPAEQATFLNNMTSLMCDVINKALEGAMTPEEVEEKLKGLNTRLKDFDADKFEQIVKDNQELIEQVKGLAENIEKLQKKGLSLDPISKFDEKLNEMLDSDKFKELASGKARKTGVFDGFSVKDMVTTNSMTNSYTGDIQITQQQRRIVTQVQNKKIHMRDVVTTLDGDPEHTQLNYTRVYAFDRNARFVTENGRLPESSVKATEETAGTKRVGTFICISKRMLKSRIYIRSYILRMLPEAVFMAEDWNILFGDGAGENLLGIVNTPGVTSIEDILGKAVVSGSAGCVKGVKGHNDNKDTIVEFDDPQDLLLDGMTITFQHAEGLAALNTPHNIVKMNDREILLRGVAYTRETAIESLTFTANEAGFKSVESPNSGDVVKTAFAAMSYAQYTPNCIVLNPMTVNSIESEKDTTGHSLDLITTVNGVKYIAARPIIELSSMAPGKYLIGDFDQAANIVEYTNLVLEWAEDVESKLHNNINLIAQEEVIFPVYMPFAFAYGDLEALKTIITKPA